MCGIVGYVGERDISSVLLVGLERLSYRGYDSSGISIISNGELSTWKKQGKIVELNNLLSGLSIKGSLGIGQTRWATHGVPNEVNAHPHFSETKKIALVHNGIIENYMEIKKRLIKNGHIFRSETDTEVLIHSIEEHLETTDSLLEALEKTLSEIVGTYSIATISEADPEKIVIARKGSPLIIALGKDENFVSSDINAILTHTKKVIYLEDNEIGYVTKTSTFVKEIGGSEVQKEVKVIDWSPTDAEKNGYEHYMLKEIFEQPSVIRNIISKYIDKDNNITLSKIHQPNLDISNVNRFIIQACGTSWHAGLIAKYLIESYARVLTEVDISSEFRYRQMITQGHDIVMAISQSGETADTLACIREAKSKFFKVLSFVNVKESSIDRESDGVVYSYAGQEIGVASTKNFIAQLATIYIFSIHLGLAKKHLNKEQASEMIQELRRIPDYIESILKKSEEIRTIAEKYCFSREFLFIGRGVNYPTALEGALKLKEISYIHATGYAAGELKHGPIALIDAKLPVVCVAPQTLTYEKMVSNIQEVKTRKGKTIIIATQGDEDIKSLADDIIYIPKASEDLTPILASVPLQLISYYIALKLDCDVDQPRNLAKSVTVE
ncbi:glutamine--fructose-6-phosphate transaminase (isomerizing) [Candidatus Marinamargulisbacteria bacterium SCGC AAA071-K20]|nr:glutamine--fructose-6-phosphate transaminase (isomerizing) [Candidatus Marinamargulisbacteria bacterium SCGC AAA071-K20]